MNQSLVSPENYIIETDNKFSGGYSPIHIPGNITPQMYLEFAVRDYESKQGSRSNVNAFSNAKKAIHFQTDIISKAFGIGCLPQKQRDSFPKKIEFCEKCGIVGSRILNKFNKIRNKIEHEYYLPQAEEVEYIIDIVELFLAATARFLAMFPEDMEFELIPRQGLDIPRLAGIEFPINEGMIYLFPDAIKKPDKSNVDFGNILKWQKDNSIRFKVTEDKLYFNWVNILVSQSL